jgi:hypothetical protein
MRQRIAEVSERCDLVADSVADLKAKFHDSEAHSRAAIASLQDQVPPPRARTEPPPQLDARVVAVVARVEALEVAQLDNLQRFELRDAAIARVGEELARAEGELSERAKKLFGGGGRV